MRRGGISLGDVTCDHCHCTIRYLDRYLILEESEGVLSRLCSECASGQGYVRERQEKGEEFITFFPEEGSHEA